MEDQLSGWLRWAFQSAPLHFNPRTCVRCDAWFLSALPVYLLFQSAHSIQSAMATHSKIHPIRALVPQLRPQNRRILGNLFPLTQPCARPLKEKTGRFYDHLRFAPELFFGISHRHLCRGCKISVAPRQTTFFWSNPVTQPSDEFDLARQSNASPHTSFGLSRKHQL